MKNYYVLFFYLLYSISITAQSSESEKRNYFIGFYGGFAFPQGELKQNIGDLSDEGTLDNPRNSGFTINALFQSKRDSWLYMGFDYSLYFLDFEIGNLIDYNLLTTNYVTNAHYRVQVQYDLNRSIKPYLEGLLGVQYFFTRTVREDFTDDNVFRGGEIETGDWGASFGGAIGGQIRLGKRFAFDSSLAYLRGTPTEYLVRRNNPPIGEIPINSFESRRSVTDLLVLKIGFQFGRGRDLSSRM